MFGSLQAACKHNLFLYFTFRKALGPRQANEGDGGRASASVLTWESDLGEARRRERPATIMSSRRTNAAARVREAQSNNHQAVKKAL